MYNGPITDVFFHPPWSPDSSSESWGSRQEWMRDPRRRRVMQTFHQETNEAARTPDKTLDDMLKDMEEAGVRKAVFQSSMYYPGSIETVEKKHKELGDVVVRHRDRFLLTATILPPEQGPGTTWDVMQNVRVVEDAHEKYGVVGVHLLPAPWGTPPNDKWFYPLYAKCSELGLTVFTYVGMPGPYWPMYPNDPIHLDEVALAFPELRIVGHHIGDPWALVMTRLAAKHRNVYICTSAWSPRRYPVELLEFMRGKWHGTYGAEKVLFGTDYPLLSLQKACADARRLGLPESVLRRFLYENAEELFWR